jgi:nitrate reductase beta subunit
MINNQERKKLMRALRSQILRYRKDNKTDKIAINSFAYDKGLSKKEVDEIYQILVDAQRIPQETIIPTVTA